LYANDGYDEVRKKGFKLDMKKNLRNLAVSSDFILVDGFDLNDVNYLQ